MLFFRYYIIYGVNMKYVGIYFLIISFVSIAVTVYDKGAAMHGIRRIRERTLLLLAAFGGSVAMYVAMKFIRHKTLHKKFMLGIPAIFVLQVILLFLLYKFG